MPIEVTGNSLPLTLLTYDREKNDVCISNFDEVAAMYIQVISGDEILTVYYRDSDPISFDAAELADNPRSIDFFDDGYCIFDISNEKNLIDDEKFLNRASSYWRWDYDDFG